MPALHHRRPRLLARFSRVAVARFLGAVVLGGMLLAPMPADAAPERRGKDLTVAEQYELGLRYLKRGYYTRALETFNRIRNYHRDDPLAVKAELAVADAYFRKGEWDQARLAYEDFMRLHPRHPDIDHVVFRIGQALYKKAPRVAARDQVWTRQAVNTWAGFSSRFPDSEHKEQVAELYDECKERLARKELLIARFYERRKAWRGVEGRARGLVRAYPESDASDEGWVLLATAGAWRGDAETRDAALEQVAERDPELAARLRQKLASVEPVPEEG